MFCMGNWASGRWRAHTPKTLVEDCQVREAGGFWNTTATPLHFGGHRIWLTCSSCGGRVGRLYLPPGESQWGCRCCHDLGYASQRKGPASRAIRSAQKIRERLGGNLNL